MAGKNFRIIQEDGRIEKLQSKEEDVVIREDVEASSHSPQVEKALSGKDEIGFQPLRYTEHKKGRLTVRVSLRDNDYFYQIELKNPPEVDPRHCIGMIIDKCDGIIPSTVDVFIYPPPPDLNYWAFEMRVKDVVSRPGSADIMGKRLVDSLLTLNFWPEVQPRHQRNP